MEIQRIEGEMATSDQGQPGHRVAARSEPLERGAEAPRIRLDARARQLDGLVASERADRLGQVAGRGHGSPVDQHGNDLDPTAQRGGDLETHPVRGVVQAPASRRVGSSSSRRRAIAALSSRR
jgi:hypothetical protein